MITVVVYPFDITPEERVIARASSIGPPEWQPFVVLPLPTSVGNLRVC